MFLLIVAQLDDFIFLRIADFHRFMWSCFINLPSLSRDAEAHKDIASYAYNEAYLYATNRVRDFPLDSPAFLRHSSNFARFTRDALKNPEEGYKILDKSIKLAIAWKLHYNLTQPNREIIELRQELKEWNDD